MMDRFLSRTLNFAVMGLIVASALGALLLGYHGLYRFVTSRAEDGVGAVVVGIGLAVLCFVLCRHRHELADS